MGMRFIALPAEGAVVAELSTLWPTNPFATAGYFESRRRVGYVPWVLGIRTDAGALESGCGALLGRRRLNRTLEIPSLPIVASDGPFWDGLRRFCRRHGVTRLELDTFASPAGTEVPPLGADCSRRSRCEFVLDLADPSAVLGSNHKRNVKRARKAGLTVTRARSTDAARIHRALMEQSMDRRRSRGEAVELHDASPEHMALLDSGAGELFQARDSDTVLSSVLVLRAAKGGYYQSAGTSPDGMAVGASHFLIETIATELRADGAQVFNLGGADPDSSLARFKEGFGASRVPLAAANCYVGSAWRRRMTTAAALVRSDRRKLLRLLRARTSRLFVYAADTGVASAPAVQASLTFRALTPEDLHALSVGDPAFRERQLARLQRFGSSYAYAVLADGQVAHVSWLLPPDAIAKDDPQVLRVRAGEAEITCCETLPDFRGRGIYGYAIRSLLAVAGGQGVHRVYMKTASDNTASQSGIEKAGLRRIGVAHLLVVPLVQRLLVWRRFK